MRFSNNPLVALMGIEDYICLLEKSLLNHTLDDRLST